MSISKTLSGYFLNDNSNSNIAEIAPFSVESTLLFHGPLNYLFFSLIWKFCGSPLYTTIPQLQSLLFHKNNILYISCYQRRIKISIAKCL